MKSLSFGRVLALHARLSKFGAQPHSFCQQLTARDRIAAGSLDGLPDGQRADFEIHVGPTEAQRLSHPQPAAQGDRDERLKRVSSLRGFEQSPGLVRVQWTDFPPNSPWRIDERSGIDGDETPPDGRAERRTQDHSRVPAAAGADTPGFQRAEPLLDVTGSKFRNLPRSKKRIDVMRNRGFVRYPRSRAHAGFGNIDKPSPKELPNGLSFVRRNVLGPGAIEKCGELVRDFTTSPPVDRLAPTSAVPPTEVQPGHPPAVRSPDDATFAAPTSS